MKELFDGEYAIPEGYTASVENGKIIVKKEENEDEKIRKWIINEIKIKHHNLDEANVDFVDKAIAWLEKQGEQKPNYCHHEVDLSGCSEEYRKAYYDGWNNCNQQHAQLKAEQKPTDEEMKILLQTEYEKGKADAIEQRSAWSEDDEKAVNDIMWIIEAYRKNGFNETHIQIANDSENWLKSLKERYTWKPSEADILLLERIANGKSNPKDFQASLGGLIGRLKELKGE